MSDERGAVVDTDEAGAAVSVHHRLVRLEASGRAELQLQELRAGDGLQAEGVCAQGSAPLVLILPRTISVEVKAVAQDGAVES